MTETLTRGCADPAVAYQRAAELVADARGDAESFWSRRAAQLLAPRLNASALAGCEPDGIAAALLDAPGGTPTQQAVRVTSLDALARYSARAA